MADAGKGGVKLPRVSKGKRPRFFDDPAIDQMMTFMLELMSEVTALRERTDTIERLLDERGFVARADIEAYRPDAAGEAERSAWAQAFIQRVMRFHEPGAS
ncbi:hypothetical protein GCM10023232_21980 [Sphingosinicella ginsenosidimutans]|uniref:Uncharacterized protein n=1 Tax=Allosphingosinicella ginsenosidimutans TaxID=1176539 RepID=A0A5C6TSQ1_9SPHN|nr:hypothetical protein [Sphingosinicella ginsenosidimutans]TXC63434.1 hypothetical protein FRZ32_07040 [Sphingosinicella ginsenosidimutans]